MNETIPETSGYIAAFKNSIGADIIDVPLDYAEIALDKTLDVSIGEYGDMLEDVPILKTAISAYRLYRGFATHHFLKKLTAFINKINRQLATPEEIERFKAKFTNNDKERNKQIEYLLTIIDSYVGAEKPEILATLYIAFLDGLINWQEFASYSETLGRLLPGDYSWLASHPRYQAAENEINSVALRLAGLGLLLEGNANAFVPRGNGNICITPASIQRVAECTHVYIRTDFGDKLVAIVEGNSSQPRNG